MVWFGFALNGECVTETKLFAGDRAAVRHATLRHGPDAAECIAAPCHDGHTFVWSIESGAARLS
jgi:hypothetical protein